MAPGVAHASEKPGELYECLAKAAVTTGAVKTDNVGEVTLEELEKAAKEGDQAGNLDEEAMNCNKRRASSFPRRRRSSGAASRS